VRCSVNKVFTSEALAYVVDEALQVFGGNGYSREFPAERAYRDARITRIYEGTNEINRLIIPTRLLKQGTAQVERSPSHVERSTSNALDAERSLLDRAKRLALAMLAEASSAYGDSLKEEQEVLADIADVVIEVYAVESTLARTEKLHAARGPETSAAALDIAQVYVTDAADRIARSTRQVVRAITARSKPGGESGSERGGRLTPLVAPFVSYAGVDGVAARRRISDAVVAAGKHPF
jgi:alkylation response protein AidB-like acyl-CoA dehydrogenase